MSLTGTALQRIQKTKSARPSEKRRSKREKIKLINRLLAKRKRAGLREGFIEFPHNASLPALHLVRAGDLFASIDTRSVFSRTVAKAINSPYSHVGVFTSNGNGKVLQVRDFRKGRAGVTRPFTEAHKPGMVYIVLRWEKASPEQMRSFMTNINRIKGAYDTPLATSYAVNTLLGEHLRLKKRLELDVDSWWTCSEQISHAADPSPKLLKNKILVPVTPPMRFGEKVDRNNVTPKTVAVDAVNNRVLKIITARRLPGE